MRHLERTLASSLGAALLAAAACGGDDPLTIASLAGTWEATEYSYVDEADHNNVVNVLPGLGVGLAIEVRANGTVIVFVDGSAVDTATATLSGDVLDLSPVAEDEFRVSRSGGTMTWTSTFVVAYDFDADGTYESAFVQIRWRRT